MVQKSAMAELRPTLDSLELMDEEEMMEALRILSHKRDQLKQTLEHKSLEVDAWVQVLGCTSMVELEELAPSLPTTVRATAKEVALLEEHQELADTAEAALFVDSVMAQELEDKTILVKFMPPPDTKGHKKLMLTLAPNQNNTYRLLHHNLPETFPMKQLEKDYLQTQTEGNAGVRNFITAVSQYTRAYFVRSTHIISLEGTKILSSRLHHTTDLAQIFILIELATEMEMGISIYELALTYNLLESLPHRVRVKFIKGKETSEEVKDLLKEAARDMKEKPFPIVLFSMFAETSSSSNHQDSSEHEQSGSDESLLIFNI